MKFKDHYPLELTDMGDIEKILQEKIFPEITTAVKFMFDGLQRHGIDHRIATENINQINLLLKYSLEWTYEDVETHELSSFDDET